jgi:hypothetical protein
MKWLLAIVLPLCAGCASLTTRIQHDWRSGPYACGPYPYASTVEVFDTALLAPLRTYGVIADRSNDPIGNALCTLTWPFWVVDEVGEVILDTAFLPVDSVYYFFFRKENQR